MNTRQFVGETWPLRARTTTDTNRALWRELARFSGRDAADRIFRTGRGDAGNINQFCNSIEMADSYYFAYEEADEYIDALLLYYGNMHLAQSVIYSSLPFTDIEGWEPKHGITPHIDLRQRYIFLDGKLEIGGTKQTFSLANLAFGGDALSGHSFSIRELLASIPAMNDFVAEPFGIRPKSIEFAESEHQCLYSGVHASSGSKAGGGGPVSDEFVDTIEWALGQPPELFEVTIRGHFSGIDSINESYLRDHIALYSDLEKLQLKVADTNDGSWKLGRLPNKLTGESIRAAIADELNALLIDANGRRYFAPKVGRFFIPEFSLYYLVVYMLSTLCRYYPNEWLEIQKRHSDEHVLIREFLHTAEHKIPLLVLNHLTRKSFNFLAS